MSRKKTKTTGRVIDLMEALKESLQGRVYCHPCSEAGGADMPIYHDAPACSETKPKCSPTPSAVEGLPTPEPRG